MVSTAPGKIAAGIAGTTGTSGVGVMGFAVFHIASARPVPGNVWVAAITLIAATVLVSSLALILDYQLKKLGIRAREKEAQAAAELQKTRLETYRTVLEKAAGEPGGARNYRELIIADALHLSVEQNGTRPADRTHAHLYGPQSVGSSPTGGPP